MNKTKKYISTYIIVFLIALIGIGGITYVIDPFFHYHKQVKGFYYSLEEDDQRYINYGILRNFDYNALIIGTSMTECFYTSQLDNLKGVTSVKTPFSGARNKEIDQAIKFALKQNDELTMVIRGLELHYLTFDKDMTYYDEDSYPTYLYDDNIFNDYLYVWNKDIFINNILPTLKTYGKTGITSFDEYSRWTSRSSFGAESVLASYVRSEEITEKQVEVSDELREIIMGNINQNIVETIKSNPEVEFYYFLTPFSIVWWDMTYRSGSVISVLESQRFLIEATLEYDNCHLYSFCDQFEIVTNLDNYSDIVHYHEDINTYMLEAMMAGEGILTEANYEDYLDQCYEFYLNYDYDAIFE